MKKILVFLSFLPLCTAVYAQSHGLTVSKLDSLPDLIQYYLEETTSKHFEDPKVPRFLLKDRTDNFVFGVGGGVEAKMFYDMQGNRGNMFGLSKSDVDSKYDNDVIDFTLYSTNLVMKVLGKTNAGVIEALVSVDFGNTGGGIRLTQAYVDVFGLRIGKANSAFSDDESISLVDGLALLSRTGRKVPQVSYSYRFQKGLRVQAGVEFSQSTSVWFRNDDKSGLGQFDILFPDLTANVYYSGDRIHLYGGVNGRIINFIDDVENTRNIPAYAAQLGMNWAFVKNPQQTHKLYLQGIWTHGMADCCGGTRKQGLSVVCDYEKDICIVPNVAAGFAGYQATFGKNTIDLAASLNYAYGHESVNIGEMYKWAFSGVVNYLRKFLTYGTVGAELIVGRRHDVNLDTYSNVRAYLFMKYNF